MLKWLSLLCRDREEHTPITPMALTSTTLDRSTEYENADMESLSSDERRAVRARTENMVVVPETDADGICIGLYTVYSESGEHYEVDLDHEQRCDCPDTQYNHAENCKHRRRVAITVTETDCPAPGQPLGEYEDTLEGVRQQLERERANILGDLKTIDSLMDGFED
jgi:hypothetical protein